MNPLKALQDHGQAVWFDYVSRELLASGGLARLVENDGVVGVTSNPAIFQKAIGGSSDYDRDIAALAAEGLDAATIFERLAVADIQRAADILKPVFERTQGRDGYISLEVSPYLADNSDGTIEEGRRLWHAVGRPNLMIKVPGTNAGVPAIRQLISEGINVNVTLLFALDAYRAVADAYLDGLEAFSAKGGDIGKIASVASFFVSRIDTEIDKKVEDCLKTSAGDECGALRRVLGKVAIANAKLAYVHYRDLIASPRWQALAAKGAQPQRLLWASTGTKNPAYSDVLYVEELIGADTVDTMPPATMEAFRDHGRVRTTLTEGVDEARAVLAETEKLGLDLDAITAKLVTDGVKLFADAADKLIAAVETKRKAAPQKPDMTWSIGGHQAALDAALKDWQAGGKTARLWARDASLWSGADEAKWLSWLTIVDEQLHETEALKEFGAEIQREGFSDVLLIGMGGSSLGPEVLAETFGKQNGFPALHVLDSTDPTQVKRFEDKLNLKRTLCIVASKSGSTLEPNILKQYFFERIEQASGAGNAGRQFAAITDPGSKMEEVAKRDGFRRIFHGVPSIGGRYSILSHFGTVPAAAMGLDVQALLAPAQRMARACAADVAIANPGVLLGCILGVLGKASRDKLTVLASPAITDFGAWLEQLVAESTGKGGQGIIPVDGEPMGEPGVYGDDRLFAYLRLDSEPDTAQDRIIDALEKTGQPVLRIAIPERCAIGAEFFRWEIATAVASTFLAINSFDQPDVEASKIKTRVLTDAYEATGSLPPETPMLDDGTVKLFANPANQNALTKAAHGKNFEALIAAHLARLTAGDYCALLAYIDHDPRHVAVLTALRRKIRDRKRVATCVGFGPRFLHSTGQAYKGGPDSGVFLQITCDDARDLPVPGQAYSFGTVKAAQARGDFDVLAERGRRALRLHLGPDVTAGLKVLTDAVERALC